MKCLWIASLFLGATFSLLASGQTAISPGSSSPNFIWPAKGTVISKYDEASKGIGISGYIGDPVIASADGVVVYAGDGIKNYGNLLIIKHDNTYLTAYGYNRTLLAATGQTVKQGQRIAEIGEFEGLPPQLHFEIRTNGKPVNPEPYLNGVAIKSVPKTDTSLSLDDSKRKCKELGFKEQTESFGKCVLRLSKLPS